MINVQPVIKENKEHIDEVARLWSYKAQNMARHLIEKYGKPKEVTASMFIWHHNGQWKRTVLHNKGHLHNFPIPHTDILEQTIDYFVPPNKIDDVIAFDGSIIIDRTKGEMTVCCDREETNYLALNLAHEVISEKKTVEEARQKYADSILGLRRNWPEPLAEELQFSVGRNGDSQTADPDESMSGLGELQRLFRKRK